MLGFITRILVLVLGYAYPAFECYKTVEKNRVEIDELRFWCQYWILAAMLTVFERVGDIFISWLPMYGEIKLGLFIYLWYPKTKGTRYVYESILRPYLSRHETDIDRKLSEFRARAWDLAIFYWKNCTEMGQEQFFNILKFLASQSSKVTKSVTKNESKKEKKEQNEQNHPNAPPLPTAFFSLPTSKQQSGKKPPSPRTINRSVSESESAQPNLVKVQSESQTELVHAYEASSPSSNSESASDSVHETSVSEKLQAARLRFRRH